jgi:hypothetical protein
VTLAGESVWQVVLGSQEVETRSYESLKHSKAELLTLPSLLRFVSLHCTSENRGISVSQVTSTGSM